MYRGNTIPDNTVILPCLDNLHRDPARYDDAESFRPERFLGDDLEALVSARQRDYRKRDHVNYGFGRRMCPGMSLFSKQMYSLSNYSVNLFAKGIQVAENSLFMQVSRYLWAFNITPKPGEPPLDMADWQGEWCLTWIKCHPIC